MRTTSARCCALLLSVICLMGFTAQSAVAATDHDAAAGGAGSALAPEAAAPDGIKGIDVSHWNDKIRWGKVADDDIEFAIAKATEGTGFEDPNYEKNRKGAREAGIVFTAYEFANPDKGKKDPRKDAHHFLEVANLSSDDMVPVLDLEVTGGLNDSDLLRWTKLWCDKVENELGVRPMIYTSPSFWDDHLKDSTSLAESGTKLWIAHWFADTPTIPASNWNSLGYAIWQWSDKGKVDGITGKTDLDVLYGDSFDHLLIANSAV